MTEPHTAIHRHIMPPSGSTNSRPVFVHKSCTYAFEEPRLPRPRPQRRRQTHSHQPSYRSLHHSYSPSYPCYSHLFSTPPKHKHKHKQRLSRAHSCTHPHWHTVSTHLPHLFLSESSSTSTPSTSQTPAASSSYPSLLLNRLDYPLAHVTALDSETEDLPSSFSHISIDDPLPCQLSHSHSHPRCCSVSEPSISLDTSLEAIHRFSASDPSSLPVPCYGSLSGIRAPSPVSQPSRTPHRNLGSVFPRTQYPSPPPTHSNPKRSVPLPTVTVSSAVGRQSGKRQVNLRMVTEDGEGFAEPLAHIAVKADPSSLTEAGADSQVNLNPKSQPHTPLSPPPTIPVSTLTLPPSPTHAAPSVSESDDLPHFHSAVTPPEHQPQQLLSPLSPQSEWGHSSIEGDSEADSFASGYGILASNSGCDPGSSVFSSSENYPTSAPIRPFLSLLEIPVDAVDTNLSSDIDWTCDHATTPTPATASSNTVLGEDESMYDKLLGLGERMPGDSCQADLWSRGPDGERFGAESEEENWQQSGGPGQRKMEVDSSPERPLLVDEHDLVLDPGFGASLRDPFAAEPPSFELGTRFDDMLASPSISNRSLPELDELDLDLSFDGPSSSAHGALSPPPSTSLRDFMELPADDSDYDKELAENTNHSFHDDEMLVRSPSLTLPMTDEDDTNEPSLSMIDDFPCEKGLPSGFKRDWEVFAADDSYFPSPSKFRARGGALRRSASASVSSERSDGASYTNSSETSDSPASTSSLLLVDDEGLPVLPRRRSPSPGTRDLNHEADLDLASLIARSTACSSPSDLSNDFDADTKVDPELLARLDPDILTRVPMALLARADPDLLRLHGLRTRAMAAERVARQKEASALESGNVWARSEARREKRREKERAREVSALLRLKLGLSKSQNPGTDTEVKSEGGSSWNVSPSSQSSESPAQVDVFSDSSTDNTPDSTFDGPPPLDLTPPAVLPAKRKKSKRDKDLKLGVKGMAANMPGLIARMMFRRRNETVRTMSGRKPTAPDATVLNRVPGISHVPRTPSRLALSTVESDLDASEDVDQSVDMVVDSEENEDPLEYLPVFPVYSSLS